MSTGSLTRTDLYNLYNVIQNTQLNFPKELAISILRDTFSQDSYYRFARDDYGFPKTIDLTDVPQDAGFQNTTTTRLFIGEALRWDVIFYPAIIVKAGPSNYVPISLSRERETVQNEAIIVVDPQGNQRTYTIPKAFLFAGIWEGSLTLDIMARDILTRDDLVSICNLLFADLRYEEMLRAGVVIKKVSAGSPSETDDRQGQDKLYRQSITLDIRTEWRREIPISSVIDAINICVDIGRLDTSPYQLAPNLTITSSIDLIDQINSL